MGNLHKFASQKGMNNCAQENQGGKQVKRFLFDPIFQDGGDTFHICIAITVKAVWKRLGLGLF